MEAGNRARSASEAGFSRTPRVATATLGIVPIDGTSISMTPLFLLAVLAVGALLYFVLFLIGDEYRQAKEKGSTKATSLAGYVLERVKLSKNAFQMKVPADVESRLKSAFHCAKCGGKDADMETFSTPLGSTASRLLNLDNTGWLKLSCERCAFTEVYSYHCFSPAAPVWWNEAMADAAYSCDSCDGRGSKEVVVAFSGTGFSRAADWHGGEYKAIICSRCSRVEFYEIHKPSGNPGDLRLLSELENLAKGFQCKKCSQEGGHTTVISGTSGLFARFFNLQIIDLIAVNCERCKFVELYDRTIRAGENLFALR